MSAFDDMIEASIVEASGVMGESFTVGGSSIVGIMDELDMEAGLEIYGDTEVASASVVFAASDISNPTQKMIITRESDSSQYVVLSFKSDSGHYTFQLKRKGKQSRGE